ncbi:hypothetical protein HWV62_4852 [Athelia sp. TMB]|nr:hypothetical protein HWV62_4852 [Athelia sp. TMB]
MPVIAKQADWQFASKSKHTADNKRTRKQRVEASYVPAIGSLPVSRFDVKVPSKRKSIGDHKKTQKRRKPSGGDHASALAPAAPAGMVWDSENWSCAYDSLMSVLYDIWSDKPKNWTTIFRGMNANMKMLSTGFRQFSKEEIYFETARDRVRAELNASDPQSFPYGKAGTAIHVLVDCLGSLDLVKGLEVSYCRGCTTQFEVEFEGRAYIDCPNSHHSSTQEWLNSWILRTTGTACAGCGGRVYKERRFGKSIDLLLFNLGSDEVEIDLKMKVPGEKAARVLELRGVVYTDGAHYTARIIDREGCVWRYDSMADDKCVEDSWEGILEGIGRKGVVAIYAKKSNKR